MSPVTIVLLGTPVASGRHRTAAGHQYMPAKTTNERGRLKIEAQQAMLHGNHPLFEGAVKVMHRIERPMPKGFSQKKRAAALRKEIWPITKPDFDNYSKMVDALKGIVWRDDAQVCLYGLIKVYSEQPKVIFTISELSSAEAAQ